MTAVKRYNYDTLNFTLGNVDAAVKCFENAWHVLQITADVVPLSC